MLMSVLLLMQSPTNQNIEMERQISRAKAYSEWKKCAKLNATRLAIKTKEPAATIADASLGLCAAHENDVKFWTSEIVKVLDDANEFARAFTADRRAEIRGKVIADIIEVRAK